MTQCNCSNCIKLRKSQRICLRALSNAHTKGQSIGEDVRLVWNRSLEEFPCLNPLAEKYNSNGTVVWFKSETIGPRHDPYSRDTLTVERNGHRYTYVSCALAGDSYILDDHIVIEGYYEKSPGVVSPYDAFTLAAGAEPHLFEVWSRSRMVEDPFESLYGRNE